NPLYTGARCDGKLDLHTQYIKWVCRSSLPSQRAPVYSGFVTAVEAYELTTQGGATDFARLIRACELFAPYCLIGGLAVNCYVEPVYTLDAHIVVIASGLQTQEHLHWKQASNSVHHGGKIPGVSGQVRGGGGSGN